MPEHGRDHSCPSAKMSAETTTSSPTVRLIGNRPLSTSGDTPSMITRDQPRSRHPPLTLLPMSSLPLHRGFNKKPIVRWSHNERAHLVSVLQADHVEKSRACAAPWSAMLDSATNS